MVIVNCLKTDYKMVIVNCLKTDCIHNKNEKCVNEEIHVDWDDWELERVFSPCEEYIDHTIKKNNCPKCKSDMRSVTFVDNSGGEHEDDTCEVCGYTRKKLTREFRSFISLWYLLTGS